MEPFGETMRSTLLTFKRGVARLTRCRISNNMNIIFMFTAYIKEKKYFPMLIGQASDLQDKLIWQCPDNWERTKKYWLVEIKCRKSSLFKGEKRFKAQCIQTVSEAMESYPPPKESDDILKPKLHRWEFIEAILQTSLLSLVSWWIIIRRWKWRIYCQTVIQVALRRTRRSNCAGLTKVLANYWCT